jgi:hypothetical protein
MDVRDEKRTITEFLIGEGYVGEEIVIRLRNVYGSLCAVAVQYSDGSAKLAAVTKNSKTEHAPVNRIDLKLMH